MADALDAGFETRDARGGPPITAACVSRSRTALCFLTEPSAIFPAACRVERLLKGERKQITEARNIPLGPR